MDFRNRMVSRLLILGLVGVAVYATAISTMFPTLGSPGNGIPAEGNFVAGTSSLALALFGMLGASLLLFRGPGKGSYPRDFEVAENVIMKSRASAGDEARLLESVREVPGGITQDALRFRTGWTRERIDGVLGSLGSAGKIRFEEFGSTRKVFARESSNGAAGK